MRSNVLILAGVMLCAWHIGCGGEKGAGALYAYEKVIWRARMAERRIWSQAFTVRDEDLSVAIGAYEAGLAANPLRDDAAATWSPRVRKNIAKLRFSSRIALAKLYLLRLENNAGVSYFRSGLQRNDLVLRERQDLGLSLVKALYGNAVRDPIEAKCWSVLTEISNDENLGNWADEIGDTLLTIPGHLVRMEIDRGLGVSESLGAAEEFLGRVIATSPAGLVSQKARLARVDLHLVLERYDPALEDIDAVIASGRFPANRAEYELLRAEVIGFGLGREAEGEAILEGLIRTSPEPRIVRMASVDLAAMKARRGEAVEAVKILRDLENEDDTPVETRTTAMFLRAVIMKGTGEWGEATTILWRICRLYPFTRAGMVAPLVILRDQIEEGDTVRAASVHRKTVEYYLSAIAMNSASLRYRHLVKDYLIESYLIMGDPAGAARTLEEQAPSWSGENGAVGLIKSAMIYLNLLNDRESGVRMLEKCLDLFPSSRYLGYVRAELDSLTRWQTVQ